MGTILEQQAADSLEAHEKQRKWREDVLADLARARGQVILATWKPTMTEQQKAEFERYSKEFNLPF